MHVTQSVQLTAASADLLIFVRRTRKERQPNQIIHWRLKRHPFYFQQMKLPFGSHVTSWAITIFVIIAIVVCIICNIAVKNQLIWFVFPVMSLIFGWGVFFPLILKGKDGLVPSLSLLTTLILPFTLFLEIWTGGKWFIPLAFPICLGGIAFTWTLFLIFKYIKDLWKAIGTTVIAGGVISIGVYYLIALLIHDSMFPWGWISFGSALGLGITIFLARYVRLKSDK